MPDSRSRLEILVDVVNARKGAGELRDVGQAGKQASTGAESATSGFAGLAGGLALATAGAVATRKGFDFMRGAAESTATLAKETAQLTRTTGMDTRTASAWASMAKERGVQTSTLTRSFTIFSKQLRGVEQGSKTATRAFGDLGISADQLRGMNLQDALMATADAFNELPAGADKAALAQQLFGRQSQDLLPLLNLGSKGLEEQMALMEKYGLTMDEAGVKKGLELAKTQREMSAATNGFKMAVGQALLPVILTLTQVMLNVVSVFTLASQKVPGFRFIVIAVAGALAALAAGASIAGVALVGITVASLPAAAAVIGLAAAVWAATWPVLAVVAGLALLAIGFVILYKRVGAFRDVVDAVIGFIVKNWPKIGLVLLALTGPVGLVIALFIKFRGQVGDVVGAVVKKLGEIVTFVASLPGKLAGIFANMFKGLIDSARSAVDTVKNTLGDIGSGIGGAISSISPFQHGGTVPAGGRLALVGEAGPELLQLPGGARVTPLQAGTAAPIDLTAVAGPREIHVHLDVEGRELAHVIARTTGEQAAAR